MNYDNLIDEMYYKEEDLLKKLPERLEFEKTTIEPEGYTIENLLNVIEDLNDKVENLTESINDFINYDIGDMIDEIIGIAVYHQQRAEIGLD